MKPWTAADISTTSLRGIAAMLQIYLDLQHETRDIQPIGVEWDQASIT
jgi:hypothetical protein